MQNPKTTLSLQVVFLGLGIFTFYVSEQEFAKIYFATLLLIVSTVCYWLTMRFLGCIPYDSLILAIVGLFFMILGPIGDYIATYHYVGPAVNAGTSFLISLCLCLFSGTVNFLIKE
ncbi:MAG: hypothetical protein AAB438_02225 [Patescibacteria group bacterium]